MHALIARLAVLYEDLRIETFGIVAEADSLGMLDYMDAKYRVNYFLRRSIATLIEIAEAMRLLNEDPDFQRIKLSLDRQNMIRWKRAVWFFSRFEPILERVRNDIGGHFGHPAARYAIQNLDNSVVGQIELKNEGPSKVGVKLHFAGDIAVTAMLRHKGNESGEDFAIKILRIVKIGYGQAIKAIDAINADYLYDRFK
jgi:hypothetical protein